LLLLARPVEHRGARRRELGLVALQAGEDAPLAGPDAFAEFFRVRLAVLAELLEPLLGLLHRALAGGRKLRLVRLHAFREAASARLLVAAEFLRVLSARTFALFRLALGDGPRRECRGEQRECGRDHCVSYRHVASLFVWVRCLLGHRLVGAHSPEFRGARHAERRFAVLEAAEHAALAVRNALAELLGVALARVHQGIEAVASRGDRAAARRPDLAE